MLAADVFADYFQILLLDRASSTDVSDAWDRHAVHDRAVAGGDVVAISTARNTHVPVTVGVYAARESVGLAAYDHAVECDLLLPSGVLLVAGPTDFLQAAEQLSVTPGRYRVLALLKGLSTVDDEGLEGADSYEFLLWPASEPAPLVVLKQAA